jgi:hypothetical protein
MYFLVFKLICLKVGATTKGHRVPMKRLHLIYKTIKIFDYIHTIPRPLLRTLVSGGAIKRKGPKLEGGEREKWELAQKHFVFISVWGLILGIFRHNFL